MRRVLCVVVVVSLAAFASVAIEPKSDLSLEMRVVGKVMSKGGLGKPDRGVARIEVALEAFRDAQDVELTLESSHGRQRVDPRPAWRSSRGVEIVPDSHGVGIPARGRIVTDLEVPLEGAAMQTVVVRATARTETGETSTEGVVYVRIGAGVAVEDESGVANFPVKEVE